MKARDFTDELLRFLGLGWKQLWNARHESTLMSLLTCFDFLVKVENKYEMLEYKTRCLRRGYICIISSTDKKERIDFRRKHGITTKKQLKPRRKRDRLRSGTSTQRKRINALQKTPCLESAVASSRSGGSFSAYLKFLQPYLHEKLKMGVRLFEICVPPGYQISSLHG